MTQHCHGGTQNLSCPNFFEAVSAKDVYFRCAGAAVHSRPHDRPHTITMTAKTVPRRTSLRKVKFGTTDMMVTEVCGGYHDVGLVQRGGGVGSCAA